MSVSELPPPKAAQRATVAELSPSQIAARRAEQAKQPKSFREQLQQGRESALAEAADIEAHIVKMTRVVERLRLRALKLEELLVMVEANPIASEIWKLTMDLPHPDDDKPKE